MLKLIFRKEVIAEIIVDFLNKYQAPEEKKCYIYKRKAPVRKKRIFDSGEDYGYYN